MRKVIDERILDSQVEFMLREVLGIEKKELHDTIIDLVKRKRLSTGLESAKPTGVNTISMNEVAVEEDYGDSHYMRPHRARAAMEMLSWKSAACRSAWVGPSRSWIRELNDRCQLSAYCDQPCMVSNHRIMSSRARRHTPTSTR